MSHIKKFPRSEDDSKIIFKKEETKYLNPNYDDTLMVFIRMTNAREKRVMINTSSSIDIFYFDAFQRLELSTNDFTPMTSSLTGFVGDSNSPLGTMSLHITFGDGPCSKMLMTKFMMVDISLEYNAIICQPTLNRVRVVVLTYQMMLKFPTIINIREIKSDPNESC